MSSNIALTGTLSGTTTAGVKTYDGKYNGTATMDPNSNWITSTSQNVMTGALFGTGAPTSTSGVFALSGVTPQPIGGVLPINNDRRGYITLDGIFHAQ